MNNTLTIQEEVDTCLEEIALNEEGYFDPDNDEETSSITVMNNFIGLIVFINCIPRKTESTSFRFSSTLVGALLLT